MSDVEIIPHAEFCSNLIDAVGDIHYGSKGDATTKAFNPLRDTVFQGNQTFYDIAEFGVCTLASAGMPLSTLAKSGSLTKSTIVRTVFREGIEDFATQKFTETAAPFLGTEGALAAGILGGSMAGRLRNLNPRAARTPRAAAGGGPQVALWDPTMRRTTVSWREAGQKAPSVTQVDRAWADAPVDSGPQGRPPNGGTSCRETVRRHPWLAHGLGSRGRGLCRTEPGPRQTHALATGRTAQ